VATGGGADTVQTGGAPGAPDHDAVDAGPGADVLWVTGAVDPARPLQGGDGKDRLELDRSTLRDPLAIDNAVGRATVSGAPVMAWSGVERFRITPIGRWSAPTFVGGPGAENVWSSIPLSSIDLGGGDDKVDLELQHQVLGRATFDGGPGTDSLTVYAGAGDQARRVSLDVPRGRLLFQRSKQRMRARIGDFEVYRLSAERLDVRGGRGAERVKWLGCRGTVDAGPGDDVIEEISIDDAGCGILGAAGREVVQGGPGDDTLRGTYFPDVLIGGPGDDVADGGPGQDRCVAERTVHCER
jgi:Ca2+-binding RTX toxin-like protein